MLRSVFAYVSGSLARGIRRKQSARSRRGEPRYFEALENRLAMTQTVGLFLDNAPLSFDGYTIVAPSASRTVQLIDNAGHSVHSWTSAYTTTANYLLENGDLLRSAQLPPAQRKYGAPGATGRLEILDWNSNVKWSYQLANDKFQLHHDAIMLPNGNIMAITWNRFSRAQAIAMGRNPATLRPSENSELWTDRLIEIKPNYTTGVGGDIVWQWDVANHLVQNYDATKANYYGPSGVRNHPELMNVNYVATDIGAGAVVADWTHFNGLDFNANTNQIIVSLREQSEIMIIDHSTTTQQAKTHTGGLSGKGGDILWRYGNDRTWGGGTRATQTLFYQHNPNFIRDGLPGAGNIMVFNNGYIRQDGSSWSTVMEVKAKVGTYGPSSATLVWSYAAPTKKNFSAAIISGVQRLPNGNTLINEGTEGHLFEVTPSGQTVWNYVNPIALAGVMHQGQAVAPFNVVGVPNVFSNLTFRATRYATNYVGLSGKTLTPTGPVEKYPVSYATPGLYDPVTRTWYLNNHLDGTTTDMIVFRSVSAATSWLPITGDWDNNGVDTTGLYNPAARTFYLDDNNDGTADRTFVAAGAKPGWLPLAGNWNGSGGDEVGLYDAVARTFHFYSLTGSVLQSPFIAPPAPATWRPLAGDWDGNGTSSVGLYDPIGYTFYLHDTIDGSSAARTVFKTPIVPASWLPLAGAFTAGAKTGVGLYDPLAYTFYLNKKTDGSINEVTVVKVPAVPATWIPLVGLWKKKI